MDQEFPKLDRKAIAMHRAEFWAEKRRNALRCEIMDARASGNPIRYWAARDKLAEAFPAID